ncbi:hypothetical protein KC887_01970 [Candidatus Kaiserbacteria bacterium]|nr:hypothetical protein [Candidatus Kaiserbacteria bacterium]
MTSIVIQDFKGIAPKINAKALADNLAQYAVNCRLDRSVIQPLRGIKHVMDVPVNTQSIFKYQNDALTTTEKTSFVGTMLANDARERIYLTDQTYPKIRSNAQVFRLGIPAPATAPTLVVTNPPAVDDLDAQTRVYVVTLVDGWGAEGPPSPVSAPVDVLEESEVVVTLPAVPTGNYNLSTGAKFRIYRTNTGDSGSYYQFVADVLIPATTYSDTVHSAYLQEVLPSATWIGPPDDDTALYPNGPLQGLTELPGGVLAGFTGNTLCFSEPYLPHAWPLEYRMSSTSQIIGLVQTQQGLVVCTDGKPYVVTGTHPEAMVRIEIESSQPCASADSIVDMGDYAIYASQDGLVLVAGNQATLVTKDFVAREDWQGLSPSTIRGFFYEGLYVGGFGDVSEGRGFIFDPKGGADSIIMVDNLPVLGSYQDVDFDVYYLLYKKSAGEWAIGEFNAGAELPYLWHSKKFLTPKPVCFSCLRVEADRYPVTVKLIADGRVRASYTLTDNRVQRLPSGYRARMWEIEITGTGIVSYVGVHESMSEVI